MLLLYRVEAKCDSTGPWITMKVCRPKYEKTETFKIEKYGFFRRKRRVVDECNLHNEDAAVYEAYVEAQQCIAKISSKYDFIRLTATSRESGEISTVLQSPPVEKD